MTDIQQWLADQGFTVEKDEILFKYLESWTYNNQFMQMDNPVEFFEASRGYVEYLATGDIADWDD